MFLSQEIYGLVVFFRNLHHPFLGKDQNHISKINTKGSTSYSRIREVSPGRRRFLSATSPWLVVSEIAKLSKHKLVVADLPNAVELPRHEELRDFRMAFRTSGSKEKFDPRR